MKTKRLSEQQKENLQKIDKSATPVNGASADVGGFKFMDMDPTKIPKKLRNHLQFSAKGCATNLKRVAKALVKECNAQLIGVAS